MKQVFLYTFGSPRVGNWPFPANVTRALTPEAIFRVYHLADPVCHVPFTTTNKNVYYHVPCQTEAHRLYYLNAANPAVVATVPAGFVAAATLGGQLGCGSTRH